MPSENEPGWPQTPDGRRRFLNLLIVDFTVIFAGCAIADHAGQLGGFVGALLVCGTLAVVAGFMGEAGWFK